jgi:hypothetical protein
MPFGDAPLSAFPKISGFFNSQLYSNGFFAPAISCLTMPERSDMVL